MIGIRFTIAEEMYHVWDDPNESKVKIAWLKQDGHSTNGHSKYTVDEVNDRFFRKVWRIPDDQPNNGSNYSIF